MIGVGVSSICNDLDDLLINMEFKCREYPSINKNQGPEFYFYERDNIVIVLNVFHDYIKLYIDDLEKHYQFISDFYLEEEQNQPIRTQISKVLVIIREEKFKKLLDEI